MTLTILQDSDDVRRAAEYAPAALSGELLAWDLPAHLELQDRGLAHLTPWDFAGPDEFAEARRFEQAVQEFWRCHARIEFAGVDLLALARFRHVSCLARLAWTAFVIRRAIRQIGPGAVYALDEPPAHGLEQPPECTRLPLLHALARGIAEGDGIPTRLIGGGSPSFRDYAAENSDRPAAPGVDLREEVAGRPYIAFSGSGGDLLRQLPLMNAIRARGDFELVQLYRAADASTLQTLRAAGHRLYHENQLRTRAEQCGSDSVHTEPVKAGALIAARRAFDDAAVRTGDDLAVVFANPHLRSHFDFVFGDYARRMARHVLFWRNALALCPPQLVVANHPTALLELAAVERIPTLLLSHGAMTPGDDRWYRCLPEVTIGAASAVHRQRLLCAGLPDERIRITGDPGLAANFRTPAAMPGPASLQSDPPAEAGGECRRILLLTSAVAAPAHQSDLPQINWRSAVDIFEALGQLAARRADWHFTIRPHPRYDQVALYERNHQHLPAGRRWRIASDRSLAELAQAADVVVAVNNRSSAIVEASMHSVPVYLLCPDLIGLDLADWGLAAWPRVTTVLELEQELGLVFADARHRALRNEETKLALEGFLGEQGGNGLNGCLAAIDDLTCGKLASAVAN
jgi:hypothetical protein